MDEAMAAAFAGHTFKVGDMVCLISSVATCGHGAKVPAAMQIRALTVEWNGRQFYRGCVVRHGADLIHFDEDELAPYPPPPTAGDLIRRLDDLLDARVGVGRKPPTE